MKSILLLAYLLAISAEPVLSTETSATSLLGPQCDTSCGQTCLSAFSGQTLTDCLQFCGCEGATVLAAEPNTLVTCQSQCLEVCDGREKGCMAKCVHDFCADPDANSSVLLPVLVDLLVLALLLGMFYFAYVYTPKQTKRGTYWRKRVLETQYSRLEDY